MSTASAKSNSHGGNDLYAFKAVAVQRAASVTKEEEQVITATLMHLWSWCVKVSPAVPLFVGHFLLGLADSEDQGHQRQISCPEEPTQGEQDHRARRYKESTAFSFFAIHVHCTLPLEC